MPLHFAASRIGHDAILARTLSSPRTVRAANDNGRPLGEIMGKPEVLRATLLHFAKHGLAAADQARSNAEAAHRSGEEEVYRHWLAICRQLDRRLARRLESSGR